MTKFEKFKNDILSLPGGWNKEINIYFSQTRDGYTAAYKPEYPQTSKNDIIINTIDESGAYLRGNYELIMFVDKKIMALYFQDLSELKKHFEKRG